MNPSVSFTQDELKGIGTLNLDDKVSLRLECKATKYPAGNTTRISCLRGFQFCL